MKTNIDYLSLVITKNCNLKCAHCLRGENEDSYMSDEVLENVFFKVGMVDCLVISGGEPFYSEKSIEVIDKIIKQIKKNNVTVNSFQIITNGTIYNENVVMILKKLCDITNNHDRNMLFISKDEFHESEINRLGLKEKVKNNEKSFETLANNLKIKFINSNYKDVIRKIREYNIDLIIDEIEIKQENDKHIIIPLFEDNYCLAFNSKLNTENLESIPIVLPIKENFCRKKITTYLEQNNIKYSIKYELSDYESIADFIKEKPAGGIVP